MFRLCKYVIIKDGVLYVLETDKMKEVIKMDSFQVPLLVHH